MEAVKSHLDPQNVLIHFFYVYRSITTNQCATLTPYQHTSVNTKNILIGKSPEGVCVDPNNKHA